jgi:hypothetical protein
MSTKAAMMAAAVNVAIIAWKAIIMRLTTF